MSLRLSPAVASIVLAACAQGGAPAGPPAAPGALRVIVTTFIEWPSVAEVANRVGRVSGVPVRQAMEDKPRTYRMVLDCPDEAACHDAIRRVAEDRTFVQSIVPDPRERIPRRPERDAAR